MGANDRESLDISALRGLSNDLLCLSEVLFACSEVHMATSESTGRVAKAIYNVDERALFDLASLVLSVSIAATAGWPNFSSDQSLFVRGTVSGSIGPHV